MKLNIYIGLRAIAYIITQGVDVVKQGIKRVNISFDNYYEYIAGQPVSKRINKRMKAQARRNLWRYKSRRNNLLNLLMKKLGCQPQHLPRTQNLQLRVKGLSQQLSPQELTNVLCQLQVKRGYKSMRGVSDNDNSDYLKEIERHEENAKQYPSIAAYLLTLDSSRNIIFTRQSYEAEYHKIMAQQKIDDVLKKRIFDIIYYQRPLKKPRVSKCDYEKNREVVHASNPAYQDFRIWRDVLNIKIYDLDKNEIEIPFQLRLKWIDKCIAGSNITKASCLKDLGLKKPTQYSWFSGKQIAGHPINKAFNDLKLTCNFANLWQDVYSATDNDKLALLLSNKYKFNETIINEILDLDFNKLGWGDFSMKAIRKLLRIMQSGKKLKEAILEVYGKVDFENVALRNVVLEQHFESCKSLYAALQEKYKIDEVQFEIDHLLKQGNKGRKAIAQSKRKEEKFAKQHPELSQYNRLKLQLWEESGGISPYQPEVAIDKKELLTDKYNLDHIVPKSKLFERSYTNQVLCPKDMNEQKNRMTGLDFAKQIGIEQQYREAIEKLPESKQAFLLMSENDIPDNWISKRQNSDYNTKCFATIFNGINIPNKLINRYQSHWNANQFTEQDARHYLLKAWVIANMSQQTVEYFDNIKQHSENNDSVSVYNLQTEIFPIDLSNCFAVMPKIKFSRKTKYGYTPRFALHQESVFGERITKSRNAKGEIVEDKHYKIRQPISKLSAAMVERIIDKAIREKIQARIAEKGNHEDGIISLVENPATHNGNPIKRVSVKYNANAIFPLHSTDGKGNTGKFNEHERKIDFVFSDKNFALKLWIDEKGKVRKEQITLMQYIKALNESSQLNRSFTLSENDMVELNGNYYYLIGVSDTPKLRPTTTLSAKDEFTIKADDWKNIKKVNTNQIGEIINTYGIEDCKERSSSQIN
jgi:CRISPR/Cas system Type II protein with McrA/HNH and RuvC-like nuclease domain